MLRTHLLIGLSILICLISASSVIAAETNPPTEMPAVEEATVSDLAARMQRGELSSHDLVKQYLDRIATIDRSGPAINSIIELNPAALAIADALDVERKNGKIRGPLHGIPVLLKDNIETADGMHTTAGSLALADSIALKDSTVAAKLRAAGAVILGKTNLSEWANFRSTRSSSGWSGRGGQTKNPYALDRNPCGSSSGTGAAIAASLATIGIGTETDGSIVCPSATNGLVGIKPSVGLVSRAGIIPIAHSQDTAGPMARSVRDAAILLNALVGSDARDAATADADKKRIDYTKSLDAKGLKGARIGIARQFAGFSPEVDSLLDRNIAALKAAGAIIVDPVEIPNHGSYDADELTVLEYEFKHDLNVYLAGLPTSAKAPRSLAELIAFNARERAREMPWFGQELLESSQARGPLTDQAYRDALQRSKSLAGEQGIDVALKTNKLDALVAPTGGPAWVTDWINGDHFSGGSSTPAAVSGYPAITVPGGFVHGLPIGLSFFAGARSEPSLIKFAYAFEQITQARKPPQYLDRIAIPQP